ncbi:LOW QUALITY PROTEIN: neural Wiskott-Aldrich syndrome protein [Strongylocentrotus purpuratus]|uniref:Wiskott-Aldrich syndrome protein n=1 Tax=Strongylocentrotus purpuratus TaxID=7668 RepID=A0A7M7HIF4_STRPU|nr:LOW QUALITY PROTEIN: neural Wiskott-Aldrich syndrome protein [Strongylocentrotus purpuratus]
MASRNVSSKLLTPQENDIFFGLVGSKSASVATAVAQVYFYENGWNKKFCGVISFCKDNEKRSYFIRIFDLHSGRMLWEQELYNQFRYDTPESFFHMFATDHCWAGLNFANEVEANGFKQVINDKIQRRQQRRQEKRRPAPSTPSPDPKPQNVVHAPSHATQQGVSQSSASSKRRASSSSKEDKKKDKADKGGRKKLTKADISLPSGFKHVSHVGWDPEKGFNVDEMDPQVKGWFNTIGVSDDQLKDQNTAKFIRNFIDQHGGLDALKEDAERLGEDDFLQSFGGFGGNPLEGLARAAGSSAPPPPPPSRGSHAPPPPPSRTPGPPLPNRPPAPPPPGNSRGPPPPAVPPSRSYPSAPAPSRGLPPPPPPQSQQCTSSSTPNKTHDLGSSTPATSTFGTNAASNEWISTPPPPPPPAAPMGGGGGGGRGGLLDQIHQGTALKKVDHADNPAPASTGRGALLDQIRGGKALKKVTQAEKEESPASTPNSGLGAALFQALQHRAVAIQDEPEDSDSEEFDEDEWEDD